MNSPAENNRGEGYCNLVFAHTTLSDLPSTHEYSKPPPADTMAKSTDATLSSESKRSVHSLKSHSRTNSKKKRLTIRMESLALHTFAQPQNDSEDPIATRDFPEECNPTPTLRNSNNSPMDLTAPNKTVWLLQICHN